MDPQGLLHTIQHRALIIVATGIVAALLAYGGSNLLPPQYEGRATLLVGQDLGSARLDYTQILAAQLQARTYASLVTGRAALESVIESLDLDMTPEQLARDVRAESTADSRFFDIVAVDGSPQRAADIANALGAYILSLTSTSATDDTYTLVQQELDATAADIAAAEEELTAVAASSPSAARTDRMTSLGERIATLRSVRATLLGEAAETSANPIGIVSVAGPGDEPVSPRPVLNAAVAGLAGLVIATLLVVLLYRPERELTAPAPMLAPAAHG